MRGRRKCLFIGLGHRSLDDCCAWCLYSAHCYLIWRSSGEKECSLAYCHVFLMLVMNSFFFVEFDSFSVCLCLVLMPLCYLFGADWERGRVKIGIFLCVVMLMTSSSFWSV